MRDDGNPEKQLLQLESASFQAFEAGKSAGGGNYAVQGIPSEVSVAWLSLAECIGFDPYTFVSLVGRVVVEQDGKPEFIIRNGMKHEYWLDG